MNGMDSDDSEEESEEEKDLRSSYTGEVRSNNTFAKELYKNLENPSSVTDSEHSHDFADHLGNQKKDEVKVNDELRKYL